MKQTANAFLACCRPRPTEIEICRFTEGLAELDACGSVVSGPSLYHGEDLGLLFRVVRDDRPKLKQWIISHHPDRHGGKPHPLLEQATKQLGKLKKRDAKAREADRINGRAAP